jgi:hypothetical protein
MISASLAVFSQQVSSEASELCGVIWEGEDRGDKALYSCNIISFSECFGI